MKKTIGGIIAATVISVGGTAYLNDPDLSVNTVAAVQHHTDAPGDPYEAFGTKRFSGNYGIIDMENPDLLLVAREAERIPEGGEIRCVILATTKDKGRCLDEQGKTTLYDRQP